MCIHKLRMAAVPEGSGITALITGQVLMFLIAFLQCRTALYRVKSTADGHTYYHTESADIGLRLWVTLLLLVLAELALCWLFTHRFGLPAMSVLTPLCILLAVGILYQLYTRSPRSSLKYCLFLAVGAVLMLVTMAAIRLLNELQLGDKAFFIALGAITLLILINLVFGKLHPVNGNGAWVKIGPVSLQPGELIKVALLAFLSVFYLRMKKQTRLQWYYLGVCAFAVLMLLGVHDFGNAVIMAGLLLITVFILRGALWCGAFAAGGGLLAVWAYTMSKLLGFGFADKIDSRFGVVGKALTAEGAALAAESEAMEEIRTSLLAMLRCGFLGSGVKEHTFATAMPASYTDYCFNAICSIFGGLFGLLIAACFICLLLANCVKLKNAGQNMVLFQMTNGVTAVLALQAMVHIGCNCNILPYTGLTLPFISDGGSSILASFICLGLAIGPRVEDERLNNFIDTIKRRFPYEEDDYFDPARSALALARRLRHGGDAGSVRKGKGGRRIVDKRRKIPYVSDHRPFRRGYQ